MKIFTYQGLLPAHAAVVEDKCEELQVEGFQAALSASRWWTLQVH